MDNILTHRGLEFGYLPADRPIKMVIGVVFWLKNDEDLDDESKCVHLEMSLGELKKRYSNTIWTREKTVHPLLIRDWVEQVYKEVTECPIKALTNGSHLACCLASHFLSDGSDISPA